MDIQLAMQLISSLGFPIFIAVYLLNREDKTIDKLAEVINQNTLAIQKLVDKLEKDNKEG
jgi:predicted transcriptional regulator